MTTPLRCFRSFVNLQHFLVTGTGMRLAMRLSAIIPRRFGHRAIRAVTNLAARRDSTLTRAIRSNLAVVLDTTPDDHLLDPYVREVLFQSASGSYDFFRALGGSRDKVGRMVEMPPAIWDVFEPANRPGRGLLAVGPHLSVQDLAGLGFSTSPDAASYDIQVLSYALPPSGYKIMNEMRATEGFLLTPSSGEALRDAADRLRNGGVVYTSFDRPPPQGKRANTATFFGKKARLWDGFAKLAVSADALLQIIWVERTQDARYRLRVGRQIDPRDLEAEDVADALWRATLDEAEVIIRAHPEQWLMFFPVWPEEGT